MKEQFDIGDPEITQMILGSVKIINEHLDRLLASKFSCDVIVLAIQHDGEGGITTNIVAHGLPEIALPLLFSGIAKDFEEKLKKEGKTE